MILDYIKKKFFKPKLTHPLGTGVLFPLSHIFECRVREKKIIEEDDVHENYDLIFETESGQFFRTTLAINKSGTSRMYATCYEVEVAKWKLKYE